MSALRRFRARATTALRRHGLRGTARIALHRVVVGHVFLHETHLWYELDPSSSRRPHPALAPGLQLVRATGDRLAVLHDLGWPTLAPAHERLAGGADLWLVLDEAGSPAFACWTFPHAVPILAARGGRLDLPPGVVCLEDSVTAPRFRGRGVAPAAWTLIADVLAERGTAAVITPVAVENVSSSRAVGKAGFEEIAVMRHTRLGPWVTVRVHATRAGCGPELAARLAR